MTDTHTPPKDKIPPSNHDAIMMLADELRESMENNNEEIPLKLLRVQVRSLAKLHHLMVLEAGRYIKKNGYDLQRLSMSLRAQNQFCRSLMVMDHLEQREIAKQKSSNELSNRDIIQ